jgi:hypothetical protein
LRDLGRGCGAVHATLEAVADEPWEVAGVVQVGVREQEISILDGSTGKGSQLRSDRPRSWYIPQSLVSMCSSVLEPVTLRAAPRKVMVG